ncbi:Cytochrome P450 [Actinacidiphila yanglinensis]|uniref:Cytochrome P450 n=1 Tax=Actinacidiphila yanglinensis TaxID=310779 RepID=A0A1H6C6I3_9ACTN|nr:cytochrome P450 [Actinacidiphila yanglinensis]SEG68522.1 Cytochrome P450 [Actinacidiphila yanglinensis]
MTVETLSGNGLFSDRYMHDPYRVFSELRGVGPIHRANTPSGIPVWVVTGYAEVSAALMDGRLRKDSARLRAIIDRATLARLDGSDRAETVATDMLNSDPPEHTRLRKLVVKGFSARRVERLRPLVQQITDELLDAMVEQGAGGTVDFVDAFAFPLPLTVIFELLGIPRADQRAFRAWSTVIVGSGSRDELRRATTAMGGYLAQMMAAKRSAPADDLLSDLVEASDAGDRLSPLELVSMAGLLLIAGHETTVNLLGSTLLALLQHPDQLAKLRARPELLDPAVEESLRYNSPAPVTTWRYAAEPMTIGGSSVTTNDIVLLALGAANHDGRFPDPDAFDIERKTGGHLSFGHGIHFCVGAALARMEAQVALGRLLERFPDMALAAPADELRWRPSVIMHGLAALPVRLGRQAATTHAAPDSGAAG